jgi:ABC-type transport system involved in multi-copper enzyme maturation permease subunit
MSVPHSTRARPAPRGGGFRGEPNPLLVRELRQALRLPRLPFQIAAIVALVGLGMLSVGSIEGPRGRPAQLGVGLFQGFVSILLIYVVLMGPATAAGAIATEREGRTLEPLLLTGLSPRDVAWGKFLAAFGTIALQVLAMVPLAAIPFLFGGVAASEVVVAVVFVLVVAAVAVAFGLAVASRTQTLRAALAISIIVPAGTVPFLFALFLGLSEGVTRKKWPFLQTSGPIWWAGAYGQVPFGIDYLVWLVLWPILLFGLPLWLFGTLTASNLASANDDRTSGPKRWFVAASIGIALLGFVTCFRVEANSALGVAVAIQVVIVALLLLGVSLLVSEPLAPSRMVRARWARLGLGPIQRGFGPGLVRGALLQVVCLWIALVICWLGGVLASQSGGLRAIIGVPTPTTGRATVASALGILVVYTAMFSLFLIGLAAFLRTRKGSAAMPVARAWTIAATVIACVVPWIVVAVLGFLERGSSGAMIVAAPSPLYAYVAMAREYDRPASDSALAAVAAALVWGAVGLLLLAVAGERARRAVALEERALAITERRLDEEEDDDDEEDTIAGPPPIDPEPSNEPPSNEPPSNEPPSNEPPREDS